MHTRELRNAKYCVFYSALKLKGALMTIPTFLHESFIVEVLGTGTGQRIYSGSTTRSKAMKLKLRGSEKKKYSRQKTYGLSTCTKLSRPSLFKIPRFLISKPSTWNSETANLVPRVSTWHWTKKFASSLSPLAIIFWLHGDEGMVTVECGVLIKALGAFFIIPPFLYTLLIVEVSGTDNRIRL